MANPVPFFFDPAICLNEKEVETKLIVQYLLPYLGYNADSWYQEVAFGNIRLDFLAFATQVLPFAVTETSPLTLVIEAKHPRENLDRHVFKLKNYMLGLRVPYGVLTNGKAFRIYERQQNQVTLVFSCSGSEISANLDGIKQLIGKNELQVSTAAIPVKLSTPNPPPKQPMKIIAVYHNKGGVGKTTTVVNLAAALAKQGKRILIIDLDSQANTTYAVGLVKFLDEENDDIRGKNITQVIYYRDEFLIEDVARSTRFSKYSVDVIPSHIELMKYEHELTLLPPAQTRLLSKLKKVKNDYDIVLIDTPPSLNLYAKIALITADFLIIPSDLKPFSHEGLNNVKDFVLDINETREVYGLKALNLIGVLPSKISTNAKFLEHNYKKRRELVDTKYNLPVMDSMICEREDLAKCLENSIPFGNEIIPDPRSVLDFKPDSSSSYEFEALAIEVLEKIK
ncbi:MAG: AAA family ATPase [Synechocystis sp.]|nr:AAA family ATPase [Synechocystis sp.]